MLRNDPVKIADELKIFKGGVVDTSTLIYLDAVDLLELSCRCFKLLAPRAVVEEFGRALPEGMLCRNSYTGNADQAVVQLAVEEGIPVLSEDRKLLMQGHRLGLHYYNTLMLLLAFLLQGKITPSRYHEGYFSLRGIARYSPSVWQVGQQVFSLYVR